MQKIKLNSRIGYLTLTEHVRWEGGTGRMYAGYKCVCDCGNEVRVRTEDLRAGRHVYCSKNCEMRYPHTLKEWLANTKPNGKCMEWQGPRTNGYGRITVKGKPIYAHRAVLALTTGLTPEVVMHTCDNPSCINPKHLRAGTNQLNTQDMVAKRRNVRGENVHTAKLTPADIRAIRAARKAGVFGTTLAKQYGVGHTVIYAICNNQIWKDVS